MTAGIWQKNSKKGAARTLTQAMTRTTYLFGVAGLVLLALVSTLCLIEGWSFVDSAYFVAVSISTVGLGDLVAESALGKLCAICLAFVSCILLSVLLGSLGDYIWSQEKQLVKLTLGESEDARNKKHKATRARLVSTLVSQLVLLGVGTSAWAYLEQWPLSQSFWFSIMVLSSVGFGDVYPATTGGLLPPLPSPLSPQLRPPPQGKLFTSCYCLLATGLFVTSLVSTAGYFQQLSRRRRVRAALLGSHPP